MSEGSGAENRRRFHLDVLHKAEIQLAQALRFLLESSGGRDAAIRLNDAFDIALQQEREAVQEQIEETGRPWKRIHAPASVYHSRPLFRLDVQTTKKRARRTGSGLWYVYYAIDDADKDGKPDTLTVHALEHSTAEPFAINTGQFDLPDDEL